jgi:hypothetical protein
MIVEIDYLSKETMRKENYDGLHKIKMFLNIIKTLLLSHSRIKQKLNGI